MIHVVTTTEKNSQKGYGDHVRKVFCMFLLCGNLSPVYGAEASSIVTGDTRLVVDPVACPSYRNPDFCGPVLVVRVPPLMTSGDGVSVSVSLEGPSGPVQLQYGDVAILSNGSYLADRDYSQNRSQAETPTNFPFGAYVFTWKYTRLGQWSCSKYYRTGCQWSNDFAETYKYKFNWAGVKLETYPVQDRVPVTVEDYNNVSARRGALLPVANLGRKMIGGLYLYEPTDTFVARKLSGKSCKVTAAGVRALTKGSCRLELTATTSRGWRYVFRFVLTVN